MYILKEEQLKKQVPSIFSVESHEKTSDKYALIPTFECIKGLQEIGFFPVEAKESRCRNSENKLFAKHLIRFRNSNLPQIGGNVPEIVMLNSHDGTCSYQLRAGIYRLVCANGLIVGNDLFHRKVRHQGDVVSKIVESANEIIEIMPKALEISESWKNINLNDYQRKTYAESASMLKWNPEEIEIVPERLLSPRRRADTQNDLWTTFNAVQENLIRGGIRYRNLDSQRRASTREVKSVSENSRLNTALWNLTEKMAVLAQYN